MDAEGVGGNGNTSCARIRIDANQTTVMKAAKVAEVCFTKIPQ
jgi:hypothetical protein